MIVRLNIETGNAAMCTTEDVVKALQQAADKLARSQGLYNKLKEDRIKIMDENGNSVGLLTVDRTE